MKKIPHQLSELPGFSLRCGCGKTHAVTMQGVSLRKNALEDTPLWVKKIGASLEIMLVVDPITREVAGENVHRLLVRDNHRATLLELPTLEGGRPHADEKTLEFLRSTLTSADLAIAIGSGTINDLTKLASYQQKIPYLAVATAPSMNGYTSAIAALLQGGIKQTIECHQPFAVIADLAILSEAPMELIVAGLGDLESKPTSSADYRLGHWLRDEPYCDVPEQVVLRAEQKVAESVEGIPSRDPTSLRLLVEALLLSGISMKLAGSSSPASGGEHLLSHYWDMTAKEENRTEGWHGAQVGVATCVTAALYERLKEINPQQIDVDAIVKRQPNWKQLTQSIRLRHGVRADEVLSQLSKKRLSTRQLREELEKLKTGWDSLWPWLIQTLRPASRIRDILNKGGAPVTMKALNLTPSHLKKAFLQAHEIRGRFTVLDLAAELDLLEAVAPDVFALSGVLTDCNRATRTKMKI